MKMNIKYIQENESSQCCGNTDETLYTAFTEH